MSSLASSTIVPLREIMAGLVRLADRVGARFNRAMPKGLWARALLIIIVPMVLLQAVVAFVFMERHWQTVTQRLSASLVSDIAALIDLRASFPQDPGSQTLRRIARQHLSLSVDLLPPGPLPPPVAQPFFSILDDALRDELERQVARPFWLDSVGRSQFVEIRVQLDNAVLRVMARRSHAYASNSHIFIVWMVGTSLVLIGVAVLFLRNQIRPILALAEAAEAFGKGREVPQLFKPRGAREVRQAAVAFNEMRRRIERQIEQRTTMLAGVSHDLRTVLTRFKLSLAFLEPGPELEALRKDVDEMSRMLEDYLAFVRGDAGEQPAPADMAALLEDLCSDAERHGVRATAVFSGPPLVTVRPDAFRRLVGNLVSNAARFGDEIAIAGVRDGRYLAITVDDNGPGIPPEHREDVFKPFLRLDVARNQDQPGSGLGLAIARDIARSHGGEITLGESPLGGLRATVRVPV